MEFKYEFAAIIPYYFTMSNLVVDLNVINEIISDNLNENFICSKHITLIDELPQPTCSSKFIYQSFKNVF